MMEEKTLEFAKTLRLPAETVPATDCFFPTKENKIKKKIQIGNSLKNELVVPMENKLTALASFNYHHFRFSKPFMFDNDGSTVSGCVGYGLERWVAAYKFYN